MILPVAKLEMGGNSAVVKNAMRNQRAGSNLEIAVVALFSIFSILLIFKVIKLNLRKKSPHAMSHHNL